LRIWIFKVRAELRLKAYDFDEDEDFFYKKNNFLNVICICNFVSEFGFGSPPLLPPKPI
jgi:hypothetical protein